MVFRRRLLGLLHLLLFLSLILPSRSDELQALLQFKSTLQTTSSDVLQTWTSSNNNNVCNFTGIVCDSIHRVTEINLDQQKLSGTLSLEALCSLESLERLAMGSNFLHGSISSHLSNCSRLKYLDLGGNMFSGNVPDLSALTKLEFLNLNNSGFSGLFPGRSLENLTSLTFLSLGDNLFDKSPFPLEILKLEKLYWLYLTNCTIEGKIPEGIGNLTLLENLELSYNNLFGRIPDGISKLSRLYQLEIYSNSLSGKLPEGFGNLTSLENFDCSTNNLEGDVSVLKSLSKLSSLQLFENRFSGEIPEEFGEFMFLEEFSVYTNGFTGRLPGKIGSWAEFKYIDVTGNFFTGPIPAEMCRRGKMTDLLLQQNNFTGGLPADYASCVSLEHLRVNDNSLSDTVPRGIWSLPNLVILDLTLNNFEGSVGDEIGGAKSLAQLYLAKNQFSGVLPERISEAVSFVAINLSSNQFSGDLPGSIGKLKKLSSVDLEHNLFSGAIPESLGSCVSLSEINLARNSSSGEILFSLGSLPSLNSLNLSNNKLSGMIPGSLSSSRLSLLDLTDNRLVGRIPDSLSIIAFKDSFVGNPGLCSDNVVDFNPCLSSSGASKGHIVVISYLTAGAVALLASFACFVYVKCSHKSKDTAVKRLESWDMKHFHVLHFNEEQVLKALKQENLIGQGGSGSVYRLVLNDGKQLAVKHIRKLDFANRTFRGSSALLEKGLGRLPEFDAEVITLSSVRHVNVVKLYCSITSDDSNLLVYEYLPNGSLWDRLHSCQKAKMDWLIRYEIAVGAAKGLDYLHHGCDRPILHRDVKSSNILLDANMKPRLADFGLAKMLQAHGARDSTQIVAGTYGYIAPEYAYTCKVNEKSDVYSFGVVLMELVTGKRPVEQEFGENKDIVQWVCGSMRSESRMNELVDSSIAESMKEDAAKVLKIALHCTRRVPALRPSMRMVLQMLEEAEPCRINSIIVN